MGRRGKGVGVEGRGGVTRGKRKVFRGVFLIDLGSQKCLDAAQMMSFLSRFAELKNESCVRVCVCACT